MTTVTLPTSQAEFEEALHDKDRMKALWAEEGKWAEFCEGYAKVSMDAKSGELGKQLGEGLQAGMAEWLKANQATAPDAAVKAAVQAQMTQRHPRSSAERALFNKHARGRAADGIFDDGGDFLQAVALAAGKGRPDPGLLAKLGKLQGIQNSYGSEVPADGGFLIPEHLRSTILQVALEDAIVRPRATVIPMDSLRVPIPMIDATSNVSSILGGVVAYWTEEAAALTESQASFGRVVLDAKKLTAYAAVPNELLQDAPAFSGFFDATFPRAIAWYEDVAFMTSTGVGEPMGFINSAPSVQTAAEPGQPTQTIVWENITKMYARMLPTSLRSAVWIASIDTFPQLATMALSVGTGGSAVWLGNTAGNSGADMPPVSILGRPVYFTEKTPALGTTGDISFVDLSYYLIGDRMQMQSMVSEHFLFSTDKVAYRIIERLDGRPWLQSAITPHNASTSTLTPFVQLASR